MLLCRHLNATITLSYSVIHSVYLEVTIFKISGFNIQSLSLLPYAITIVEDK